MIDGVNEKYSYILAKCRILFDDFEGPPVQYIFREINIIVVDILSKYDCNRINFTDILRFIVPPSFVYDYYIYMLVTL